MPFEPGVTCDWYDADADPLADYGSHPGHRQPSGGDWEPEEIWTNADSEESDEGEEREWGQRRAAPCSFSIKTLRKTTKSSSRMVTTWWSRRGGRREARMVPQMGSGNTEGERETGPQSASGLEVWSERRLKACLFSSL